MNVIISRRLRQSAFTLTEIMVTCALSTMVMAGIIIGHLAGARMFQFTRTKLGGTDDARSMVGHVVQEIRAARIIKIGTGDATSFTECGVSARQQGNALEVYPTTDTNVFVRYYLDTDACLHRKTNSSSDSPIIARYITNSVVFTSEDFNGNVLSNHLNNRVVGLTMQFYQIEYPIVQIATNKMFDFYQLRTKVTRRALSNP